MVAPVSPETVRAELNDLRRKFRMAVVGYLILAITTTVALWTIGRAQSAQIRDDINTVARLGCYSGRINVRKFNAFVDEIIATREQSAAAHMADGEITEARLDRDAINRYRKTKLHVATDAECNRKLLPPIQPPRRKEPA